MRALALLAALVSLPVFSCPLLQGHYSACRSTTGQQHGSTDMTVTQTVQNRITTYTVSAINIETQERETEVYKADGKINTQTFRDPESGITLQTSTRVICTGSILNIDIDIKLDGQAFGYSKVKVSKAGKQLIIDSKNFNGEEEISDREICE